MKLAGFAWFFALLVWLPYEDTQIWLSLLLASTGVLWMALRLNVFAPVRPIPRLLRGATVGVAIPVGTLALMAFKSGLHGHGFPDFTVRQVWEVIQLLPLFGALGAGFVFLQILRKIDNAYQ